MGAGEAAHHGTAQCGRGRVSEVPEKGGWSSSRQGNVESWCVGARRIQHAQVIMGEPTAGVSRLRVVPEKGG